MEHHPRLGILMLDTQFPRVFGDVGNPKSFDFPVMYRVVPGATPDAIVRGDTRKWVDAFKSEGQALVDAGCTGLATTCGFLTLVRDDVAKACGVPVASSSLEQVGLAASLQPPGQQVGILTISKNSLSQAHLEAADVPASTPIWGMEGTHFADAILNNQTELDTQKAETEMIEAALRMCEAHPDIGAIVLECTNMPPYADEIKAATGRATYSILTYLSWFHDGLPEAKIKHTDA